MEKAETRELPGNDASWFGALLGEQSASTNKPESAADDTTLEPETLDLEPVDKPEPVEVPEDDLPTEDDSPALGVTMPDTDLSLEETSKAVEETSPDQGTEDPPAEDEPPVVAITEPPTDPAEELPDEARDQSEEPGPVEPIVHPVPAYEADESPVETTSEMVGQMWTAQKEPSPLDDWAPEAINKAVSSRRSFRWTSLLAGVLVIALVAVGLVLLPSVTRSRADTHKDMLVNALSDLRRELPATQTSLETATEPSAETGGLGALSTQLTALTARASAIDTASQADLPATPPFTSSAPIDELEPIRQRMEPLGTTAQTIQRRISNLVEYRMLMADFLALPELPETADSATQTELRVVLASAQAASASILAQLPSDVSLEPHQNLARSINDRFATWQIDYLEALRTENSAAANTLIAELTADLAALDAELTTPLSQIRRQTDADLIDLARSIDEVTALANGTAVAP